MIVVNVGGSLYDHTRLGPGLQGFLASLPEPVLLVPGGGDFANSVRKLDALHDLGEESCHWLTLHAMNLAGEFLNRLGISTPILDAGAFDSDLPHSWNVTSDSIAARAAIVHGASRLILLKSIDIPPGTDWTDAAQRGWVDPHFPKIVAGEVRLTIEAVNFRRRLQEVV